MNVVLFLDELTKCWTTLFLVILLAMMSFHIYYYFKPMIRHLSKVPTIDVNPVFGYVYLLAHAYKPRKEITVLSFLLQAVCALCTVYNKEKIVFAWVAFRPMVLFYKPETVEAVLSSNSIIDKAHEYSLLHPWLGTGLLTSTGDKWRTRRKLLTPSFHFRILEDFIPVYNEQGQILIKKMKTMVTKEWVDIVPLVTMCALEIISGKQKRRLNQRRGVFQEEKQNLTRV